MVTFCTATWLMMVLVSQCMIKAVLQLKVGVYVAEDFRAVGEAVIASSLTGGQQLVAETERLTMETALLVRRTECLVSGRT